MVSLRPSVVSRAATVPVPTNAPRSAPCAGTSNDWPPPLLLDALLALDMLVLDVLPPLVALLVLDVLPLDVLPPLVALLVLDVLVLDVLLWLPGIPPAPDPPLPTPGAAPAPDPPVAGIPPDVPQPTRQASNTTVEERAGGDTGGWDGDMGWDLVRGRSAVFASCGESHAATRGRGAGRGDTPLPQRQPGEAAVGVGRVVGRARVDAVRGVAGCAVEGQGRAGPGRGTISRTPRFPP